jgi:4-amino-4-deoxy-L-arabinose transferase-like glycosyltransferase
MGPRDSLRTLSRKDLLVLAGLVLVSILVVALTWVGFMASDDGAYLVGAEGWLEAPPYAGANHWEVRSTLVLPMAACIGLFGSGELQTSLASVLYYAALMASAYVVLARRFGSRAAWVGTALLLTTPLFPLCASTAGVDLIECLFLLLSLWFFHRATAADAGGDRNARAKLLVVSGVTGALAVMTRETSLVLPAFYAVLFACGYGLPRKRYLMLACGAALPVLLEMLFFAWQVGDPLHRVAVNVQRLSGAPGVVRNAVGSPLKALFVNDEFALLFAMGLPAAVTTSFSGRLNKGERQFVRLLVALAVASIAFVTEVASLRALPRYYAFAAFTAAACTAVWLVRVVAPTNRGLACALGAVLVSANLAALAVANREPLYGERLLVAYAADHEGAVYTNPHTARRARRFLIWAGLDPDERVRDEPPPPGSTYFFYPRGFVYNRNFDFDTSQYTRRSPWIEQWRPDERPRLAARILSATGIDEWLPASVRERIERPHFEVVVYRVP